MTLFFIYVYRKCFGPCIRHGRTYQWGNADTELACWRRIDRFRSRWHRLYAQPVETGHCYNRNPTQSTTTTTTAAAAAAITPEDRNRRERFRGIGGDGDQARGVQPRSASVHHNAGGRRGNRDRLG